MADATTARSDTASRNEQLRPSDIAALCDLIGGAERYCMAAERHQSRRFMGFKTVYQKSYDALCEGHLELLRACPDGSDRDLVILAGHASLMADQIKDMDVGSNTYAARMLEGIHTALISISGIIASRFPIQVDEVGALWPELGQSIRSDAAVARQMIADAEGR